MLERFDLLKNSVKKALIDLNNPVQFEESDFQLINEIIKVLAQVKLSVEALCRSDANLCTADATLKFLFQQLRDNDSILASKLKTHLLSRMKDRRRNELSGVLNYLQNPHTEKTESNNLGTDCDVKELFSSPSKMAIKKQIISLTERMENNDNEENEMKIEPTYTTSKTDLTLKEKLQNEIENSMKAINPEAYKETDLSKIIKQEMNLYEASSTRGYNLEKTYKNLLTIPPTSIEPERAFSASSYLCNKLGTGFGTGFSFGATPATTASTGFGTPFGGTSFGTPASTAATGFGTTFGTPATSTATGIGTAFGTPASTSSTGFGTSFGTPATSASTGFGTFSSFGTPTPAATTSNLFSGFGGATTTAATGFTGFGAGTSLNTGFGTGTTGAFGASTGFGTGTTGAFGTSTGFGTGTTGAFGTSTGFGAGPSTGFSGFGTNTAPSFSGFGSSFGAKPITSTGFGGFGNTLSNTTLGQLQPQQQQAPVDPNQAIYNSIFNCNIFGDERDTILAKWNLVQASWGTGKGYYSMTVPPVEYTQQNPYCRFKAIGYSVIPGHDNKEGLAAIIFNKKEIEVKAQKDQLLTSLSTIMGNKPNLIVSIHDIRAISDSKTQVLICVQEKGMTGSVRKIPANDLANFLLQPMQKQQLGSLGTENVFAHVMPDSDQLKEYLSKAPTGVDIRIWKQAQLDNPNPEKYIPVPLIGFEQLKWRSKCQEKETGLHRGFMEQVSRDVIELKRRHSASVAQIAEQKRKLLDLQHRVLQILVKQEVTRKAGMALQPEEEVLKGQLENMQTQISVPTQFKGRLNELLAQIRMQTQNGKISTAERYNMEPGVQEDIKQFLRMEQNGINHLVEIINTDMAHLKTIRDGMQDLIQRH